MSVRSGGVEGKEDDSGIINLKAVNDSATPEQIESSKRARPGQADLFEEKTAESAVNPAEALPPSKIPHVAIVEAKPDNRGAMAGIAIAVLGIAAAFAIVVKTRSGDAPTTPSTMAAKPAITAPTMAATTASDAPKPAGDTNGAAPQTAASPSAVSLSDLPNAANATGAPNAPVATGPNAVKPQGPSGTSATTTPAPSGAAGSASAVAVASSAPSSKPGDLQAEMARAVGATEKAEKPAEAPATEPAAGGPGGQSIPEQPSQGSVQAAVGVVMSSAKSCVAGADDVTRANVTFGSGGTVSSVSVNGWAAAHGQTGCVQSALKSAKVGPFSKPSYTFSVTIRP